MAARLLARSEAGRARATDLLEAAVHLLPEVAPRQLSRSDQQYALGGFAGLTGDAAALILADTRRTEQERATQALQLLEAGRAILLSQSLDTRSDLTDLSERHPEMAARFVELRNRLDQPAEVADGATLLIGVADRPPGATDRLTRDRHLLAREFADTLAKIRNLAGFSSFALPPTIEELLTQAAEGPVVVFNVSGYRSDALLLTSTGVTAVSLPRLGADTVIENIVAFRQALHAATSGRDSTQRRQAQATLVRILEWLWHAATEPVLTALGHLQQPPPGTAWPRVWWIPGGRLACCPSMPLAITWTQSTTLRGALPLTESSRPIPPRCVPCAMPASVYHPCQRPLGH
jgi:hypothetical protein